MIPILLCALAGFGLAANSFKAHGAAQFTGIRREVPKTVQAIPSVRKIGKTEVLDQRPIQFKLTTVAEDVVNLRTDATAKSVTISTVTMPTIVGRRVKLSELQNGARPAGLTATQADLGQTRRVSLVTFEQQGQKTLIDLAIPEGVPVEIILGGETVYKGTPTTPSMFCGKRQIPGARQFETAYFQALALNSKSGIRVGTEGNRIEIQPRTNR